MTTAKRSAYGATMAAFIARQRAADALLEAVVVEREANEGLDVAIDFVSAYRRLVETQAIRDRLADRYLAALRGAHDTLDEPVPYVPNEDVLAKLADLTAACGKPVILDEPDFDAIAEAGDYHGRDPFADGPMHGGHVWVG